MERSYSRTEQPDGKRRTAPGQTEKWLAALPHLLFASIAGLSQLLLAFFPTWFELYGSAATAALLGVAGTAMVLAFVYAWRRRWPLWSASWYGYWAWLVLILVTRLNERLGVFTGWQFNNFVFLGAIGGMILGYIWLVKRAPLRGLLAILFLLPVFSLSFLEFIPPLEEGLLYLVTGMIAALAAWAMLTLREIGSALLAALAANLTVGLLAAYVSVYRPEYPGGIVHVPDPMEFVQAVGLFAAISLAVIAGPLLFWSSWRRVTG